MGRGIDVFVEKDGTITIEAHGYGSNCYEATAELERRLGTVRKDRPTSELYEDAVEVHEVQRA